MKIIVNFVKLYIIIFIFKLSGKIMNSDLDRKRNDRLIKTGKWFKGTSSYNNRDIYLTYLMPLLLIASLCCTLYFALSN